MKSRIEPFLALLEARYLPLLFAAAPQSYVVFLWLWTSSDKSSASFVFAILGAMGYEMVYVGAIAWAEGRTHGAWVWSTAIVALVFSVAVAIYVHWPTQGYGAILHAGFPLVAWCYTMTIHSASKGQNATLQHTTQYAIRNVATQDDNMAMAVAAVQVNVNTPDNNNIATQHATLQRNEHDAIRNTDMATAIATTPVALPEPATTIAIDNATESLSSRIRQLLDNDPAIDNATIATTLRIDKAKVAPIASRLRTRQRG